MDRTEAQQHHPDAERELPLRSCWIPDSLPIGPKTINNELPEPVNVAEINHRVGLFLIQRYRPSFLIDFIAIYPLEIHCGQSS